MDIFPGHVTFDDLFKQSDWLLRLPLVCFDYFRVSLLLSHKKFLTFFQVLFIFSHIQNLTNFDIDSCMYQLSGHRPQNFLKNPMFSLFSIEKPM